MNETKLRFMMQGVEWIEASTIRLEFKKSFGGRKHSRFMYLSFVKTPDGKYRLVPPRYESNCLNSLFDFKDDGFEIKMRTSFNRQVLVRTVKDLKDAGVWEHISNQDFLIPNMFNKKSKKERVRETLKNLLA